MPEKFENLRIVADIQTPIATDDGYLSLEGVIWREIVRRDYGFEVASFPRFLPNTELNKIRLPFAETSTTVRGEKFRFYKCSLGRKIGTVAFDKTFWTKRFPLKHHDIVDRRGRKGLILTAGGHFKAKQMPVFTQFARRVEWFCVGDKSALEKLLPFIAAIGKYTNQGFGAVLKWQIETVGTDFSVFDAHGAPQRAVPADTGTFYAYRSPAWLPENQTTCAMPRQRQTGEEANIDFFEALNEF